MVINQIITAMDSRNKVKLDNSKLEKGHILIDIGAYPGDVIEYCIEKEIEVHSFEPHPMLYFHTVGNHKNKLVTPIEAAGSNFDGMAKLYLKDRPARADVGSSLIVGKTNVSHDLFLDVKVIDIGKYLSKIDRDIQVLKIDAEGSEYDIVNSILDHFDYKRIKHWYIEDHGRKIQDSKWKISRVDTLQRVQEAGIELMSWD